jgi:hypothetical protein
VELLRRRLRPLIHWRTLLGVALGAAAGALYAHFIGCRTGACPITGNPWVAGFFGAWIGGGLLAPAGSAPPSRE